MWGKRGEICAFRKKSNDDKKLNPHVDLYFFEQTGLRANKMGSSAEGVVSAPVPAVFGASKTTKSAGKNRLGVCPRTVRAVGEGVIWCGLRAFLARA